MVPLKEKLVILAAGVKEESKGLQFSFFFPPESLISFSRSSISLFCNLRISERLCWFLIETAVKSDPLIHATHSRLQKSRDARQSETKHQSAAYAGSFDFTFTARGCFWGQQQKNKNVRRVSAAGGWNSNMSPEKSFCFSPERRIWVTCHQPVAQKFHCFIAILAEHLFIKKKKRQK